MGIEKILVPVDFTPASDAALDYALTMADACGAEVEVLHVWSPNALLSPVEHVIFADTPEGVAMERRLSAAECDHPARVCGRLEFGEEPSQVILAILHRERFDLVVMGLDGHVSSLVSRTAPCKVVALRAA
jgi:nucleotide-binding universal stress UspA family protein